MTKRADHQRQTYMKEVNETNRRRSREISVSLMWSHLNFV